MAGIQGKNTRPEIVLRKGLHRRGFRYGLHSADVPGKPDMVFRSRHAVIFVHGCFWHGHGCARGARTPKANRAYWTAKIGANRARDAAARQALTAAGWRVETIWECELKDMAALTARVSAWLGRELS